MQNKKEKGFTLLEILLVIAVIGILASIVLIAINPNKQIAQARNTARKVDINTLEKALRQYSIDNAGQLPNVILNQYKVICRQGITDPSCINLDVLVPTYIAAIPRDTQSNTINTGYSVAVNPNNTNVSIVANLAEQFVEISINKFNEGSGASALLAANSCQSILSSGYSTGNGVYWINLPTSGATQIYCLMDTLFDGGGWMLAMKATRGTTFNYDSAHWTTTTTLNPTDLTRNDADAKYHTMNYYPTRDLMAVWPDIPTAGGSIPNTGSWTWLEKNFYNGGNRTTPINFFSTMGTYNNGGTPSTGDYGGYFIKDAKTFSGWANGVFSSQVDIRFYGFNFINHPNYGFNGRVRWGFGWNENGEGLYTSPATLATGWAPGSDDVSGGIGMASQFGSYSAGDIINCCQDNTGINRSARVELYIR